ncbi:OmpA family protein [Mucilaginibacter lappiensis]|uniref:Outer membrane protein OmpA-like peptidoglycan-associated protein n=1 Tax=Mucilaginibacter lappiensis TaxID=354630 RepID=A0A841JJW7_9SPHI|nr:OmpA family protein [Mucilaginibacter lappiensis]MBB6130774.1 outer membrane protein OmpA-like peptidoglycan-associated protein [Mucilaginibacter lappiensis]
MKKIENTSKDFTVTCRAIKKKENMQRKFLNVVLGLLISGSAWSQTYEIKKDTTVKRSEDKRVVVTNHFFDNWFIGAGAGAQIFFADHNRQMKLGDRFSPAYEFYVGKWFSPNVGVRAAINGLKIVGVNQDGAHGLNPPQVYDASQWLYKMEFHYLNIHGDVLFNMSNIISGYKENRFYNISPYIGVGWMYTWEQPKDGEVSANAGIFNSFRLNDVLDLTLDVRGNMVNERLGGTIGNRWQDGLLTGAIGIAYKFKKRGWETPKIIIVSYNEAALDAIRNKVNALEKDNEALKQQLANAKTSTVTDVKVENKMLAAPILITFEINKSTVSNETRVNLGFFAKVIKEANPDVVYNIKGYADKGTGSEITNTRLSRERAEAIYNILVREFGVSQAQLKMSYEGGVGKMFYDDPRLSRAVITIAE